MSWLIFKTSSTNSSGMELVLPRREQNSSVWLIDHDPRHHAESLEAAILAFNPGSGYEYECFEVDDTPLSAVAERPPAPPISIVVKKKTDDD